MPNRYTFKILYYHRLSVIQLTEVPAMLPGPPGSGQNHPDRPDTVLLMTESGKRNSDANYWYD